MASQKANSQIHGSFWPGPLTNPQLALSRSLAGPQHLHPRRSIRPDDSLSITIKTSLTVSSKAEVKTKNEDVAYWKICHREE